MLYQQPGSKLFQTHMELNLYLDEDEPTEKIDLHVHLKPEGLIVFKNINANPVIYDGWFHVSHEMRFYDQPVDSSIPAADVLYVTAIRTKNSKETDANG